MSSTITNTTDYTKLFMEEKMDSCVDYLPMIKEIIETNLLLVKRIDNLEKHIDKMNKFNDASIRALWVRTEKTPQDTLPSEMHDTIDSVTDELHQDSDDDAFQKLYDPDGTHRKHYGAPLARCYNCDGPCNPSSQSCNSCR